MTARPVCQLVAMALLALACADAKSGAGTDAGNGSLAARVAGPPAAVCDSIAAYWRKVPAATLHTLDSTMYVISEARDQRGCLVTMNAKAGIDSVTWSRSFWGRAEPAGWTPLVRFAADGPDGGSMTWQRSGLLCEVRRSHDGGDDTDPRYVPSPEEGEETLCWAHAGPPFAQYDEPPKRP